MGVLPCQAPQPGQEGFRDEVEGEAFPWAALQRSEKTAPACPCDRSDAPGYSTLWRRLLSFPLPPLCLKSPISKYFLPRKWEFFSSSC